jgi:predicted transcriptional regulator of viral defense system
MRLTDQHARLLQMRQPVFTTADAAAILRAPTGTASQVLGRLASPGHVIRLKRGLWALPDRITPLQAAHWMTAPFPAYVSLQSALFHHGMVSQIPEVVYVVSPARTQRIRTLLGTYSIHHLQPPFFFGYDILKDGITRMALPEKALIDLLYLSPARSNLFRALPEVTLPRTFSRKRARTIIGRIPAAPRRQRVRHLYETLLAQTSRPAIG